MNTTAASSSTGESTAVSEWLRSSAQPITTTDADFAGTDLAPLIDQLAAATVVGLGESTRFSRQTFGVRERLFRALVQQHGFRALAIQDTARSGTRLDRYVRAGEGDPATALGGAWRPWRTEEMIATLTWIRAFNEAHPDDPVAVFGVEPPAAEPSDYDAVLDHVAAHAPELQPELDSHFTPIRTAHRIDEHVQTHQGIHPGRPFAEHARDALALLETLASHPDRDRVLAHARLIRNFHEQSVAGKGGFAGDEKPSAGTIIDRHQKTGAKIVYWDGIGHTSALLAGVGQAQFHSAGSYLRAHFGADYVSVAVGFHHGDLGMATAPDPQPDLLDALLGTVDLPVYFVDLRGSVPEQVDRWRREPAKLRTISGIYDPAKDAEANTKVDALNDAFDILIHIRETSPVRWLPEFNAE